MLVKALIKALIKAFDLECGVRVLVHISYLGVFVAAGFLLE